jgi:hypothetical protein
MFYRNSAHFIPRGENIQTPITELTHAESWRFVPIMSDDRQFFVKNYFDKIFDLQ